MFSYEHFGLSHILSKHYVKFDWLLHAANAETLRAEHVAELAKARREKRQVHEEAEGSGRSMLSQRMENPIPIRDDDMEVDFYAQAAAVADKVEAAYMASQAAIGEYDDDFYIQASAVADTVEAEIRRTQECSRALSLVCPDEDWFSDDELLIPDDQSRED